jgi:hypothetical protein
MYQMDIKCNKWLYNIPNGYKIFQHLPLQDLPKFGVLF